MTDNAEFEEGYEGVSVEEVTKAGALDDDFEPVSSSTGIAKGAPGVGLGEEAPGAGLGEFSDRADSSRDYPAEQDLLHFVEPEVPQKSSTAEAAYAWSAPEAEASPFAEPASRHANVAAASAAASSVSEAEIGEPAACFRKNEQQESESCGCCSAWLSHFTLPAAVWALLLWHSIPVTGAVLFGSFTVLLSLAYFSVISVISYASMAVLVASATFKVYRLALAALCKDSAGSCYDFNPFSIFEGTDVTVSADFAHKAVDVALPHINDAVLELKRLFLVKDVSSLKFGVILWAFTYVGCCFNGLTLLILGLVMAFTLPKIYDTYKVQIDRQMAMGCEKFNAIYGKLKDRIPYLKKKSD